MTITSALEAIPTFTAVGAGTGMGFFFLKFLFEWFGGRMDKRQEMVDAGTKALIEHLQNQITSLTERQVKQDTRIDTLQNDLDACRDKHAESEARVKQLEATMLGMGDARQQAQRIVSEERLKERP